MTTNFTEIARGVAFAPDGTTETVVLAAKTDQNKLAACKEANHPMVHTARYDGTYARGFGCDQCHRTYSPSSGMGRTTCDTCKRDICDTCIITAATV
jgi:hypothetical protein